MGFSGCVKCEPNETKPLKEGKCRSCGANRPRQYCDKNSRIAAFFATLKQAELWPSVEPFESCSIARLITGIDGAKKNIGHSCEADPPCALPREIRRLHRRAHEIQNNVTGLCLHCISSGDWDQDYKCSCAAADKK